MKGKEETQPSTMEVVSDALRKGKNYSRGWHEQILHWRDLYDQKHYKNPPKQGEERYEDPTYTNVVDLAVGTLLANELEFRAFGWSPSAKEQRDTDKIEKFLAGLIQVNSEREESFIPYEVFRDFVRDGCGVLYSVWDPRLEEMYYDEFEVPVETEEGLDVQVIPGYREVPIRVQVIDPTSIFVVPGGPNRWVQVLRVERKTVYDVETEFNILLKSFSHLTPGQRMESVGELVDYWCYKEEYRPVVDEDGNPKMENGVPIVRLQPEVLHAITFQNEVISDLKPMPNYRKLPFTIGFFKPVDRKDSKKWGHSILPPLESSVALLERAINRRQHQITVFSSLPLIIRTEGNRKLRLDPSLGSAVQVGPNDQIGFPLWQGNPPDTEMQISFLRARAQQSGFSDVMFGAGPSQVSGYGLSQLGDQNRIRLEQPVKHLELFWARWAKQVLELAAEHASGFILRVYGLLKGKEFNEQVFAEDLTQYNVRCMIKPEFPNDKVRNHAMATQVRGLLSNYRIMQDYLGVEQPDEEQERKLVELAQNDPAVIRYGIIAKLKEMADNNDEVAQLVLKEMSNTAQTQAQVPPNARPANPEQLMGTQSPTGQPTQQETGQLPPGQSDMDMLQNLAGLAPNMQGGLGNGR